MATIVIWTMLSMLTTINHTVQPLKLYMQAFY